MISDTLQQDERRQTATAYHEAGHAVVGVLLGRVPLLATIMPDGMGMVGKVEFEPNDGPPEARLHLSDTPAKRAYARIRVLGELAGSAAHDLYELGRTRDAGDHHDDYWAEELTREMVNWEQPGDYLRNARQDVKKILRKNWPAVKSMARALLELKTMRREQILQAIEPHLGVARE